MNPASIKLHRAIGSRNHLLLATALLLLAGPATRAQDIISVKFTSPKNSNQNYMYAGDYAGAPGVRTNNWNNLLASADGNASAITLAAGSVLDSAGTTLPNFWVYAHPTTSAGGGGVYNRGNGVTNDAKMFGDVSDTYQCTGFGNYGYIDFTNIPFAMYNVYCYFKPDNGNGSGNTRGGFFCITNTPGITNRLYLQNQSNDVAQTQLPNPSTAGANYIPSTTTTIPSGGTAWSTIQGGNYAVFNNLTNSWTRVWFGGLGNGAGGKDDLGNYVNGGSGAVRFKVAGFQIVQVNPGQPIGIFFNPPSTILHAGNPSGTQSTVDDATASDQTNNVTTLCTFTSDNTNIVTVSGTGVLTPGTNGTAHVIAGYQGFLATNTVTVIGPTSLYLTVAATNLLSGNGQGDTTSATLYANFSDASGIAVNAYQFVSFSGSSGITVTANGTLKAVLPGAFSVTGTYDGLSVTTNNVGLVQFWTNPVSVPAMNIHFTGPTVSMLFHDLAGYPGVRSGYWNNFVQNTGIVTNELDNPMDDQGNILTNVVVQMIPDYSGTLYNQSVDLLSGITTNESVLFGDCYDLGMNNGTTVASELIVSNVPYSTYDVYCYVWNDTANINRPAEFTIDGVTQYRVNSAAYSSQPGNTGSGYVIAEPQPDSLPSSVANIPYGNVVKFAGVTDSTLVVQIASIGQDLIGDAAAVTRVRLAGFQIVPSLDGLIATNLYLSPPRVPFQYPGNPTTYALTLLANFNNGTAGGNITALSGVNYLSSNTNVFEVDTNGIITAGLTPGMATLTITYQTNTLTTTVTNLAPVSVAVVAVPNTVYPNGALGAESTQAKVLATFTDGLVVDVSAFNSIVYVDQGSAAATLNSDGTITVNNLGEANLGASYLGTTYVGTNALSVLNTGGTPALMHQYNFHDAANSTTIVDSVGGANGKVYPALGTNKSITLDGQRAIFPGDGDYTTEPYIALPSYLISSMGDVSIELWCGQSQLNAWARFFGFGNTPKGTDPHTYGGTATTSIQLISSYVGTGIPEADLPGNYLQPAFKLTNGVEYQMVLVCAPNANVASFYINGVLVASGTPTASFLSTSVNDLDDWLGVSLSNSDLPLAGWINNLAIYEGVMTDAQVASDYAAGIALYQPLPIGPATNSVPLTFSVANGSLTLSWPPDHQGWTLQAQTNSLNSGLGTNWVAVPNSTTVTNLAIPVNATSPAVFYRLVYQK